MTGRGEDPQRELREWLEPLPPAAAARLIAEARHEAEQLVRARLIAAWTDVLLDGVRAELHRGAPTAPSQAAPPSASPSGPSSGMDPVRPENPAAEAGSGWYVHCVIGGDHPRPDSGLEGIEPGTTVETVTHDDLAAVVSPVALSQFGETALRENLSDLEWVERIARSHERVQEQIARQGTPIPMRLCSIYRDREGVRAMLEREADGLRDALGYLEGRTEWGVQAFANPDDPVDAEVSGPGEPADGTSYLRSRLAARDAQDTSRQRLDEACAEIHGMLVRCAVDAVLSAPQRPEASGHRFPMILNGAYLVDDAERPAFDAALEQARTLAAGHGIELRRTGPWPPYNFVRGAIGAAW